MATKTARKLVDFTTPSLLDSMLNKAYKAQPRWFDEVSFSVREDFAWKYASKTWDVSPTGNPTSVVVSYPRANGTVRMVDLDSGMQFWMKLSRLTSNRVSGRAQEFHYDLSYVRYQSDYECEVEDITMNLDWEVLKKYDEAKGKIDHRVMDKHTCSLVRLPRHK